MATLPQRLLLCLCLVSGAASAQTTYHFTILETLGGALGHAQGINDHHQIAGDSELTGDHFTHATRWNNTTAEDLGTLGGLQSYGYGINATGRVVGWSINAEGKGHATLWNGGPPIDLGELGSRPGPDYLNSSVAYAINNANQIVGYSATPDNSTLHAVLWNGGGPIDLGVLAGTVSQAYSINDAGKIVGVSTFDDKSIVANRAVLWSNGTITDLGTLGGPISHAWDINNAGDIVGSSSTSSEEDRAVLWSNGSIIALASLGGSTSEARAINDAGVIVGFSQLPDGISHAVMWRDKLITDLNDLRDPDVVAAGWVLLSAHDIADSGCIVGVAMNVNTGRLRGFLASPVDAPPLSATPATNVDTKTATEAAPSVAATTSAETVSANAGGGGATGLVEIATLGLLWLLAIHPFSKRWRRPRQ